MNEVVKCECGLRYVPGIERNEVLHAEHHDKWVNGQPVPFSPYERVIGSIEGRDVLESSMDLPQSYRIELANVAMLACQETPFKAGYDGSDEDIDLDARAYILREKGRGVGLIILRRRDRFWSFLWDNNGKENIYSHSTFFEVERWVVERIWVVSRLRKQHFAQRLVSMVADHLKNGIGELGWELPLTDSGRHLVRSVCPHGFWGTGDAFSIYGYEKNQKI